MLVHCRLGDDHHLVMASGTQGGESSNSNAETVGDIYASMTEVSRGCVGDQSGSAGIQHPLAYSLAMVEEGDGRDSLVDTLNFHKQQQSSVAANSEQMTQFWQNQNQRIEELHPKSQEFKLHSLPLARIKKIMKLDEDNVKMISADAPVVLAKACEIFILELTLKAWTHTEANRRRTLQRNDISKAAAKSDMYDFLIDIVPRDDTKTGRKGARSSDGENIEGGFNANMMTQEQMEVYIAMQQKYMEMYQQMAVTSQQDGNSVDGSLSATNSSLGINLSSMTNMTSGDMTAFAQQFQMPTDMPQMDAETAATYAQYYQQYYQMQMANQRRVVHEDHSADNMGANIGEGGPSGMMSSGGGSGFVFPPSAAGHDL